MEDFKVMTVVCAVLCMWVCHIELKIANAEETRAASDEETKLQQALLIVKLLKSEFPRLLLRANSANALDDFRTTDSSLTCATTTSIDKSLNFRRFHSIDRGGRRIQYDDIFGAHPDTLSTNSPSTTQVLSTTNTNITTTTTTTTAATTTTTTTTAATTTATTTTVTPIQQSTSSSTSSTQTNDLTTLTATTTTKIPMQKVMLSLTKTTKNTHQKGSITEDNKPTAYKATEATVSKHNTKQIVLESKLSSTIEPNLSQVAAELEKELASGLNFASRMFRTLWRATTKIHLAGSTRYPIPLPENHAFCYTNPRNALCRTYIG